MHGRPQRDGAGRRWRWSSSPAMHTVARRGNISPDRGHSPQLTSMASCTFLLYVHPAAATPMPLSVCLMLAACPRSGRGPFSPGFRPGPLRSRQGTNHSSTQTSGTSVARRSARIGGRTTVAVPMRDQPPPQVSRPPRSPAHSHASGSSPSLRHDRSPIQRTAEREPHGRERCKNDSSCCKL